MGEMDGSVTRREALKTTAKVAGVAAFATPVVMGVFSAPALGVPFACDPAVNSRAIQLITGGGKRWNINCASLNTAQGRYNAQQTTFTLPGAAGAVTLNFGMSGVDNFPVECSYYTITAPATYTCTAIFRTEQANGTLGCSPGATQKTSLPGICEAPATGFSPPGPSGNTTGALPLPYCDVPNGAPNGCDSGVKLVLVSLACCPA